MQVNQKKGNNMKTSLLLVISFFIIATKPAQAYLDPGTGSYLLQIIVGGALGGAFLVKSYWQRIVLFFSSKNQKKSSDQHHEE